MVESAIPDHEAIEETVGVTLVLNHLGNLSRRLGNLHAAGASFDGPGFGNG